MLSNSFMNNPVGQPARKGPLGHHQTEKEAWGGGTNLNRLQRIGLGQPIMIGETIASNMQNLSGLNTQNQLQVSSTIGRNMADQLRNEGIIPHANLNNMSALLPTEPLGGTSPLAAAIANPYDVNSQNTNHQMYQSFVRGNLMQKRKSQYSERKASRENRYHLKH